MSVICEEVFDEKSHPSIEEIREYANKIGINPDEESQLLPLAAEGLMRALPPAWKPCFDEKSKSYYYYNSSTGKTQWEHPLDEVYRGLVKKARKESQSLSLGEPTEDATYARDELPSYEESPNIFSSSKKADPITQKFGARKKDIKLSPLKTKLKLGELANITNRWNEQKLVKQKSEEQPLTNRKISLINFSSFDEKQDKIIKSEERPQLKLSGDGAMFLKSNTQKETPAKNDLINDIPRGILRDRSANDLSKSLELDKSDKDDDDKKSVRFNLEGNTDAAITLSDRSSSDEEPAKEPSDVIDVKITPNKIKSRFTLSPSIDPFAKFNALANNPNLKLIKPNPADFIKPKLTLSRGSDSEEESLNNHFSGKPEKIHSESPLDSDTDETPPVDVFDNRTKKFEEKAEKKIAELKQTIWEQKNDEIVKYKDNIHDSQKEELERILVAEKNKHEERIKTELEKLSTEMETRNRGALEQERNKYDKQLEKLKKEMEENHAKEEAHMKQKFETKREELEKYYEEKLAEIEKNLAETMEKNRDEIIFTHNSNMDQLKQNHSILIEQLKKEFVMEEHILRRDHQQKILELKTKMASELESEASKSKSSVDERQFEKLRCEKRLLEDKYRCLKDKYIRLKTEVKMSIEKKQKKKEQATTGSETEQSRSTNKDRTSLDSPSHKSLDKPPTPKHARSNKIRQNVLSQDMDTSASDRSLISDDRINKNAKSIDYDTSENSANVGRSRKKLFSRLKSNSASRVNGSAPKAKKSQRPCSPVENLRRQLQKLEDLEDQFPQNQQSDTYHLRYPFSDGQKFEGSSELEFFRHRIHLERDSIKRAKESLRTQKTLFQQRQKELKLKHGSMARHTFQQLCQEEKELTDMEVSLHRTRSLLGEKVIRLRHLEQSLHRATAETDNKQDDATLSDISSHSASSGISSTEFATADGNFRGILKGEHLQESSEIIQSLENLNSEIKEIWDVLRKQQQSGNIAAVLPPFVYPDLGWPILAGTAAIPAPPSIPTLADRLNNYRQQIALANAQSTVVTHANQGATTTLVERTRNLRHWLKQAGNENIIEGNANQATL